jgi:hypothetical protein
MNFLLFFGKLQEKESKCLFKRYSFQLEKLTHQVSDFAEAAYLLPTRHWFLSRYIFWTMGDLLRK